MYIHTVIRSDGVYVNYFAIYSYLQIKVLWRWFVKLIMGFMAGFGWHTDNYKCHNNI